MPYAATAASGRPSRRIKEKTHFLRPFLVRAPISVMRSQEIGREITYEKGIRQHQARERRANDLLEGTIDVPG